jgi:hypothetical protein
MKEHRVKGENLADSMGFFLKQVIGELNSIRWSEETTVSEIDLDDLGRYYQKFRDLASECSKPQPVKLGLFGSPANLIGRPVDVPETYLDLIGDNGVTPGWFERGLIRNILEWAILRDLGDPHVAGREDMYKPLISLFRERIRISMWHGFLHIGTLTIPVHRDF